MHVLRNVDRALKPGGLLLDVHPTADDPPIRAAQRGLGFIDARPFAEVVTMTDAAVDAMVAAGSLDDVRRVERDVEELYDDPEELIGSGEDWNNLRLPAATRRRIRAAEPPLQVLWRVDFRLLRKRRGRPRRRS